MLSPYLGPYLHSNQALTLALPLMSPHATLIFKIFLSPSDPQGHILASQMSPFFLSPNPAAGDTILDETEGNPYEAEGGCELRGYDRFGRRGGVWVRKPRSSRSGSAGESAQSVKIPELAS